MALTKVNNRMIDGSLINVVDYGVDPTGSSDSYAGFQAALDAATDSGVAGKGWTIFIPQGTYLLSQTLEMPNNTVLMGAGRSSTYLRPTSGFTGAIITDKGNAGKINIKHIRIDALDEAGVTDLIKLGYGASAPFGEGELYDLYLRGGSGSSALTTCNAVNIKTNVVSLTEIETLYCNKGFVEGSGSTVTTYSRCFTIGMAAFDFQLAGPATLNDCEIEAPDATSVGVYAARNTGIYGLTYSQSNTGVTNPYAIEIDASGELTMTGFKHFDGGGASTLTHLFKDNRTAFPLNWGPTSTNKSVGIIGDRVFVGSNFHIQEFIRQSFQVTLTNDGGTIKHRITSQHASGVASLYSSTVSGASVTLTATPTGTDGSTAFATGLKIGSSSTNALIFNTPNSQNDQHFAGQATVVFNSSGTDLTCSPAQGSIDVNGTTNNWLLMYFYNATTGANYNLTTLPSGKSITVNFDGYLA